MEINEKDPTDMSGVEAVILWEGCKDGVPTYVYAVVNHGISNYKRREKEEALANIKKLVADETKSSLEIKGLIAEIETNDTLEKERIEEKLPLPDWIKPGKPVMVVVAGVYCSRSLDYIHDNRVYCTSGGVYSYISVINKSVLGKVKRHYPLEIVHVRDLVNNYDLSNIPGDFYKEKD